MRQSIGCFLVLSLLLVSGSFCFNSKDLLGARIRHAASLSERGGDNITAAFAAVEHWRDIVRHKNGTHVLPRRVAYLVHRFYASSLVRIGRDASAIDEFDKALREIPKRSYGQMEWNTTKFEQARCWQRLMNYNRARDTYLDAGRHLEAATCSIRLGDVEGAIQALRTEGPEENRVMLTLLDATMNETHEQSWALQHQVVTRSPWETVLGNNGPFDDPLLVHLDDKALLHTLLSSSKATTVFWPEGKLVSRHDLAAAATTNTSSLWIAKSRSGYGSHGNQLLRLYNFSSVPSIPQWQMNNSDILLLQRLVDPPYLLLDGKKFSLRVYVVRFGTATYLSRDAIVKFARDAWESHGTVADQHMTNSGRGEAMMQADFGVLRETLTQEEEIRFWNRLRESVRLVLSMYDEAANKHRLIVPGSSVDLKEVSSLRAKIASMGHPKILGFDYVVDANKRPWLIEVNRFPGLEPRDSVDTPIKQAIVASAWEKAHTNYTKTHTLEPLQRCSYKEKSSRLS